MVEVKYITAGQLKFPNGGGKQLSSDIDAANQNVFLDILPDLSAVSEQRLSPLLTEGMDVQASRELLSRYSGKLLSSSRVAGAESYPREDMHALLSVMDHMQPTMEDIAALNQPDALKNHLITSTTTAKRAIPQALSELGLPPIMHREALKADMPRFMASVTQQLSRLHSQ